MDEFAKAFLIFGLMFLPVTFVLFTDNELSLVLYFTAFLGGFILGRMK